ncbi:MAG: hypothetical protein P1U56_22145 [Saprospiraceae bacterium]|nr:hypothetical protein [Saprospiraceae bacterium]
MRNFIAFILILSSIYSSLSQNISVSETGNAPDGSAMFDVQSTNKGMLIPRMTGSQRQSIDSPANGLLVFDVSSQSFWFYDLADNDEWVELVTGSPHLRDEDNDTEINVETNPDEDIIRMHIGGEEVLTIEENGSNAHRFETNELSRNLFFGHNAGLNSSPGFNTFLGYETGSSNLGGAENVFIGYQAGMENVEGDDNVILGYRAGFQNNGSFNVFIGRHAGYDNEVGNGNVFLGHGSGTNNIGGSNNVFLGYNTGQANNSGIENTFVGEGAGFYNSEGSQNTFIGEDSGRRNRTGDRNVALGNHAMGPNLSSGDHGDGNIAVGFNAGFSMTNSSFNTYLGEQAGYFNATGDGNTLIGNEAGILMTNGRYNTALGYRAYRTNNGGNNNIAIGDSAMYITSGSLNIVIGDKAGEELTGSENIFLGNLSGEEAEGSENIFIGNSTGAEAIGSNNIFIGDRAGGENNGANQNIFIGTEAGLRNSSGNRNTFLGMRTGLYNSTGSSNTLIGFFSGDRNTEGTENTFIGTFSGHGNTIGNNNVSLGFNSLYGNSEGSGNVGIGHYALANIGEVNDTLNRIENTAVGFEAGDNDLGSYNITIGSKSEAGNDEYNIALGHEASTKALFDSYSAYDIAVGYQAIATGSGSISIGRNTSTRGGSIILGNDGSAGTSTQNSIGIGNDVTLSQDNSIVLGDIDHDYLVVGIGTNAPNAKLDIDNNTIFGNALTVRQAGLVALNVLNNRGISVGGGSFVPPTGIAVNGGANLHSFLDVAGHTDLSSSLDVTGEASFEDLVFVNTTIMPAGYHVAIDGKVACTEIRVQAVDDWPDYVFEDDYPLMSISDFRTFIKQNNHLPGVPAASEINEDGIEIGKTQEILLEKIEELSLYILQLEERLSNLESGKN